MPPYVVHAAQTSAAYTPSVEALSDQIVRKELELDQLVTTMHLKNRLTTIDKRRRQWLWAMLNSMPTEAGLIDATAAYNSHTRHVDRRITVRDRDGSLRVVNVGRPNPLSGDTVAGILYPQIIGQEVNAAGNFYELTHNVIWRERRIHEQIDPKRSLIRVKALAHDLDSLLFQRQKLLAETAEPREIFDAEGTVLDDLRIALLAEFARHYVRSRGEFAWQNTLDGVDLARNAVGAAGNQISVHAAYTRDAPLNGVGNILSLLAAIGITTRPYIGWTVRHADMHLARNALIRELPECTTVEEPTALAKLEMDEQHLRDVVGARVDEQKPTRRFGVLTVEGSILTSQEQALDKFEGDGKAGRERDDMVRSTAYGPTKMANTILGVITGYRKPVDSVWNNRRNGAGNLTYTCGQGYNFLELWRERIEDERHHVRLKAEGKLPEQVLSTRLYTLDQLTRRIAAR
jgi:hypothetical protein